MTKPQEQTTNVTDIPPGSIAQDSELGYEEEDRSQKSKLQLLKQALLPIFYYNFTTLQGRRQYCDLITEDPLSGGLMWLPFVILLLLVHAHTTAALWTSAVMNIFSVSLEYYHATYKPQYPRFFWLSWVLTVSFVAMGIVNVTIHPEIDPSLISTIAFTALFATAVISILVKYPFTMQMAQHKVPKETLESAAFLKLTTILALVWVFIFGAIMLLGWFTFLYDNELSNTVQIILGTALPLVILIVGRLSMNCLAEKLKSKMGMNASEKEEDGEAVSDTDVEELA